MKTKFLTTAAVGLAMLGFASAAQADISIKYSIDGGVFTTQNVVGPNAVSITIGPDGLDFKAAAGAPPIGSLHIVAPADAPTSHHTYDIIASRIDFVGVAGTPAVVTGGMSGTALDGTFTANTWIDTSNTLFGTPGAGKSFGGTFVHDGATGFGFENTIGVTLLGNYSQTVEMFIDTSGTSGQLNVTASQDVHVPEPGTLALLGVGLSVLGLRRRKRSA